MAKDYHVGLDIGDTSVGYAVVDEAGNLLRYKGQDCFGVRLFTAAEDKNKRRVFRSARRRQNRRRVRVTLLQGLLAEEMANVDPNFFIKLNSSDLIKATKNERGALFNDINFTDKEYYGKYPTIFHLRAALCDNSKEKFDIRLIYLALHHIIKYRGNFLFEGMELNFDNVQKQLKENQSYLDDLINDSYQSSYDFFKADIFKITSSNKSLRDIQQGILQAIGGNPKDKRLVEIIKLLSGASAHISKIFTNLNLDYKASVKLSEISEDTLAALETTLGDEYPIFMAIKNIYDAYFTFKILKGNDTISQLMLQKYKKHGDDLHTLKDIIKKYYVNGNDMAKYDAWFKGESSIYGNYVWNRSKFDVAAPARLLKEVKILAEGDPDYTAKIEALEIDLENDNFLPRQVSKENGSIPYQYHCDELIKILDNQGVFYPALAGAKDKILSIMKFRIPYFVGPLNKASPFAWLERGDEKIYPWNFNTVVDLDASEENFITRMTNKCSYLLDKDVLPKCSLLYEEYCLLAELNSIRVNNYPLPADVKAAAIEKLFKSGKTIKDKAFVNFLLSCDNYDDVVSVVGYQKEGEFASKLTSYAKFHKILADRMTQPGMTNIIERIILIATIISDKDRMAARIRREFEGTFSDEEISRISALKFSKWGRFSRDFLQGTFASDNHGELWNIMEVLRAKPYMLIQLLGSKNYNFAEAIEAANQGVLSPDKDFIAASISSPRVRKIARQSLALIDEITKIMGKPPAKIILESTRRDDIKQRTETRIFKYTTLLSKAWEQKDDFKEIATQIQSTNSLLKTLKDIELRNEKKLLYITQLGKCMYTGDPLNFAQLNSYDVDHILPQSIVKDDSIDNKVLVIKKSNADKSDDKVLSPAIRRRQQEYWAYLAKIGLISPKKYKSLTRNKFSENDVAGFIARQLVDTGWAVKAVRTALSIALKYTDIVMLKASVASNFRSDFGYLKCRNMNNLHHAKDAYLTAVLGNIYDELFSKTPYDYLIANRFGTKMHQHIASNEFFLHEKLKNPVTVKNTGEVIWVGAQSLEYVRKIMSLNSPVVSCKLERAKGGLFDQNIVTKAPGLIPKKTVGNKAEQLQHTELYGGYKGSDVHHFVLIRCLYKEKPSLFLERVSVYQNTRIKTTGELIQYLSALGYLNIEIVKDDILLNQLVELNGVAYYLRGHDGKNIALKQASEFLPSREVYKEIATILNDDSGNITHLLATGNQAETVEIVNNIDMCYRYVVEKLTRTPFSNICGYTNMIKTLVDSLDIELSAATKIKIIREIFSALVRGSTANLIDLKALGGSENCGKVRVGKNLTSLTVAFVTKSVTGLHSYRKIIKP